MIFHIHHLPFDLSDKSLKPVYTEFEGWSEDLRKMNNIKQLPKNLNKYISFLENELKIPIVIISVGPDRKETIFR